MKNNASDDLQYGINEAALFFYRVVGPEGLNIERKLTPKYMTPTMMMGIGYFIALGYLTYRGSQTYGLKESGRQYYFNLIKNDEIEP